MSIRMMTLVWDLTGLPSHLKIILLRLADHANDEGHCHPGQDHLAEKCSQAERTVRRNLDTLQRLGLVEVLARRRRAPQDYQLHLPTDPAGFDWGELAGRALRDESWTCPAGWFNQDRPRVAGQESLLPVPPPPVQDRQPVAVTERQDRQPVADLNGSRPATDRDQDRQPMAAKTGNPLPVSISTIREPPVEPPLPQSSRGFTTPPTAPPSAAANPDPKPELPEVRLARQWAHLSGFPFEGARRSLVPAVIEAVATLALDGVTVDEAFLAAAHRAGVKHPAGWWMATPQASQQTLPDCDQCCNRRVVVVLGDGRRVPTDHDDAWQSEHTARCRCVDPGAAA